MGLEVEQKNFKFFATFQKKKFKKTFLITVKVPLAKKLYDFLNILLNSSRFGRLGMSSKVYTCNISIQILQARPAKIQKVEPILYQILTIQLTQKLTT